MKLAYYILLILGIAGIVLLHIFKVRVNPILLGASIAMYGTSLGVILHMFDAEITFVTLFIGMIDGYIIALWFKRTDEIDEEEYEEQKRGRK